jgi:hypothetical protein
VSRLVSLWFGEAEEQSVMQPEPPQTVAQAVERLLADLPAEEQQRLRSMKAEDLADLHFSLGMGMRNAFPIWGNEPLLRSCAIERRPRIVAEMEKSLARAGGDKQAEIAIREFFGRLMQQESVHPDDASAIIIHAAWERLQDKHAGRPPPRDRQAVMPKKWWQFWR